MNSLAATKSARKPLQFIEGTPIPFIFGAQDAASGLPCVPEMVWVQHPDQVNYAAGWASVAGDNDTTRFFLAVR